jgi:hypothetical protein
MIEAKKYDSEGRRIRKQHLGILGEISQIMMKQHSLVGYPFWDEIMEKIEEYGGPFTVGKLYKYRLKDWLEDEEETGKFESTCGTWYKFRKMDELPQYDSIRELKLYEIESMEEVK